MARSSSGDPARTLALLWREAGAVPRRGPARTLDLHAVVAAATRLADAGVLTALSMRAVARAVGVAPMTLYTYVPGKAELLDLMLDAAYAAMPRRDTTGRGWRERVTSVADENLAWYDAHPWAIEVSTLRPPLGPGLVGKYEHELAAWDGLGLTDTERDDCLTFLLGFVRTAAQARAEARTARAESAMDDQQWWQAAGPLLAQVLSADRYPRATRVGAAAGAEHGSAHDPDHAYRFGLARVLDAVAVLVERPARS
jgi:AcrR family transcriptional regulator